MKLEPPKMLEPRGKSSQAAIQLQYTFFLDSESGNCFGNQPSLDRPIPQGNMASNSWNLKLTYRHTSGGDCTQ